ncbi:hypothetical protein HYU96_02390, partial [Candidatus Daviesbacteria bacterium]|nr:hypothetical protein [Candidatus Daviesbacteria bacterium]
TTAEDGRRKTVSNLSIKEVFETLVQIAKTQGEVTVEKKVSALADLLKKVDPISAKHLVRVPLGVSRLGIGDPTILDAFAKLKLGDRSKRKLLEGAYNRVSDLGLIGETLWQGGLQAVNRLQVTVGRARGTAGSKQITGDSGQANQVRAGRAITFSGKSDRENGQGQCSKKIRWISRSSAQRRRKYQAFFQKSGRNYPHVSRDCGICQKTNQGQNRYFRLRSHWF